MEKLSDQLSDNAPASTLIAQLAEATALLDDLDPESPDWEAVADCAARIAAALERRGAVLAALRASRREALGVRRAALRQALSALVATPDLEFYHLAQARLWSEEQVDAPLLETATAGVHELRAKVEAHAQERARALSTFATPEELMRLAGLTNEVNTLRTQALTWFDAGDEPPAHSPAPEPATPAEPELPAEPPTEPPTEPVEPEPATAQAAAEPAAEPPTEEPADLERTLYIDLEFDDLPTQAAPGIDVAQVLAALRLLDVAAIPEAALSDDEWERFARQLVVDGDVAAAYWVARSLEGRTEGGAPRLPAPLLAAVQASWWLQTATGTLVADLMRLIFDYFPGEDPELRVAAAAAGLLPALIAPDSGANTWLNPNTPSPALNGIIEAGLHVSAFQRPIAPADIHSIHENTRRRARLRELEADARHWLETAPHRSFNFQRASNVWLDLTGESGQLRGLVVLLADFSDRAAHLSPQEIREQLDVVKSNVKRWRRIKTSDWIIRIDRELLGKRPSDPITGTAREDLIWKIEEVLQWVEEWLKLMDEQTDLPKVELALLALLDAMDGRQAALDELAAAGIGPDVLALLQWALADLSYFLGLSGPEPGLRWMLTFPEGIEVSLDSGLHYRLLALPEVGLDANIRRSPAQLDAVAPLLYRAVQTGRTLAQALDAHIARLDFRFVPILLQNDTSHDGAALHQRCYEARLDALQLLDYELRVTGSRIEQSYAEGLLDDIDHALLTSELVGLEGAAASENYGWLLGELQPTKDMLEERRSSHRALQWQRWEAVRPRLQTPLRAPELVETVSAYMETALGRGNIVATDERLARLESLLDAGGDILLEEYTLQERPDIYREYVATLRQWEPTLSRLNLNTIARQLRLDQPNPYLRPDQTLSSAQVQEVRRVASHWNALKAASTADQEKVIESLGAIMHYLGFTFGQAPEESITWKTNGRQWAYATMSMTAADESPIPQFGSQRGGKYDVLCLWEPRGLGSISLYLHTLQLNLNSVIVIFLGSLSTAERFRFRKQARGEKPFSVALLDEVLLLFLMREASPRINAFLRCALPLGRFNPYSPTGPVFAEMFFGRSYEKETLQQEQGKALVFGGRQLGKSALLQQVQREFHSPANDRYVLREEIKFVGVPAGGYAVSQPIWRHLQLGLEKLGLLAHSDHTAPEEIADDIREMMRRHPNRRILVLFDEADNFLAADLKAEFREVSRLKRVMDDTDRRFKVVLAGLHNVQRYHHTPNQPFAGLEQLTINPLDPHAAKDLVQRPIEALGFRFPDDDDTPVYSILAYTNYHPGLIQLFCHRLLTLMHRKPVNSLDTIPITLEDVETVFRQVDVQKEIRNRLDWTLDLDDRYRALAYMIVLDQSSGLRRAESGYSYDVDTLLKMARAGWPAAFSETEQDEFQMYLDEMVGLGVLVRSVTDTYRLRSPNLIRLMGNQQDIKRRLDTQTRRSPNTSLAEDSYHASLDPEAGRFSPFTYQQARILNTRSSGVGLVFGSAALGVNLVPLAFEKHFLPQDGFGVDGIVQEIDGGDGGAPAAWFEAFLKTHGHLDYAIVYRFLRGSFAEMSAEIETALAACERYSQRAHQWMRAFFVLEPEAALEWLRAPQEQWMRAEDAFRPVVPLRRWDVAAVVNLLERQGRLATEEIAFDIDAHLHGWPYLLDHLNLVLGRGDYRPAALKSVSNGLINSPRAIDNFLKATGVDVDPQVRAVIAQIAAEPDGVPEDMLVPDFLGDHLSPEMCQTIVEYGRRLQLLSVRGGLARVDSLVGRLIRYQDER